VARKGREEASWGGGGRASATRRGAGALRPAPPRPETRPTIACGRRRAAAGRGAAREWGGRVRTGARHSPPLRRPGARLPRWDRGVRVAPGDAPARPGAPRGRGAPIRARARAHAPPHPQRTPPTAPVFMATAGPASPGDGRSGDAPPRGFLVVTVHEATGKNKDEVVVWDPSFVEGFVKGEGRGRGGGRWRPFFFILVLGRPDDNPSPPPPSRDPWRRPPRQGHLRLPPRHRHERGVGRGPHPPRARRRVGAAAHALPREEGRRPGGDLRRGRVRHLRVRHPGRGERKEGGGGRGVSGWSARAPTPTSFPNPSPLPSSSPQVPIDKFFELFKPGAGGEGGFIRVGVAFYPDARALERRAGAPRRKGGLPLLPLLLAGGVAVAAKVLAGRRRGG